MKNENFKEQNEELKSNITKMKENFSATERESQKLTKKIEEVESDTMSDFQLVERVSSSSTQQVNEPFLAIAPDVNAYMVHIAYHIFDDYDRLFNKIRSCSSMILDSSRMSNDIVRYMLWFQDWFSRQTTSEFVLYLKDILSEHDHILIRLGSHAHELYIQIEEIKKKYKQIRETKKDSEFVIHAGMWCSIRYYS